MKTQTALGPACPAVAPWQTSAPNARPSCLNCGHELAQTERALCHVLRVLAELAELRGQPDKAKEMRLTARGVVEYIADGTESKGMRAMFMNTPNVKRLMSAL